MIGVALSGQLHMSDIIRLRYEDFAESPYRSQSEPFLYCDGHIQLDVPIRNEGEIIQVAIKKLHFNLLLTLVLDELLTQYLTDDCCIFRNFVSFIDLVIIYCKN